MGGSGTISASLPFSFSPLAVFLPSVSDSDLYSKNYVDLLRFFEMASEVKMSFTDSLA